MLRRFEEQMTVHLRREAGDNDRGNILQREFLFPFRRFANQLPVSTTNRTLRAVYADDVIGHTGMPVSEVFKISNPPS